MRDLARSINEMSAQLSEMRRTIRQTERTHVLAQLAAGLAHQLRNSLTGARMSIQLHAKRFPPREGDETLNVALRQLAITEEQVRRIALARPRRAATGCALRCGKAAERRRAAGSAVVSTCRGGTSMGTSRGAVSRQCRRSAATRRGVEPDDERHRSGGTRRDGRSGRLSRRRRGDDRSAATTGRDRRRPSPIHY